MSDRLTTRPSLAPVLGQAAIILVAFAAAGALCGLVWFQLWTPPLGVVSDGEWLTDEEGLRGDFAGTGLYVVIAGLAGLVLGALCAFLLDRAELVTLLAVVAGAVLAGWLMLQVGLARSPADPEVLAGTAEDGGTLAGQLRIVGDSPLVAFPGGALIGLAAVFLGVSKRPRKGAHRE